MPDLLNDGWDERYAFDVAKNSDDPEAMRRWEQDYDDHHPERSRTASKRAFPLNVVLTAYTGRLLCEMGELYEVLNYMHQDNLFTHQLPRASTEAEPYIYLACPNVDAFNGQTALDSLDSMMKARRGDLTPMEVCQMWITGTRARLAEIGYPVPDMIELEPIPQDDRAHRDPIAELEAMVGQERVVVVCGPDAVADP